MASGLFNKETIIELAMVAKYEGWEQMAADAYRFVTVDCEWHDEEDKRTLLKILINEVGSEIVKKLNTKDKR